MPDFTTYDIAMIIQDIYDQYQIPDTLQLHMLRVAGVCKMICDHRKWELLDSQTMLIAALLHDMGNIVRFDLENTPPGLEKLQKNYNVEHLKKVQKKIISKFGSEEHSVNMGIAREVWASDDAVEIIGKINFAKLRDEYDTYTIPQVIVKYCDLRVWPYGVISVAERLHEAAVRYKKDKRMWELKESIGFMNKVEQRIFSHCILSPQDINDESINPLLEDLRWFDIQVS